MALAVRSFLLRTASTSHFFHSHSLLSISKGLENCYTIHMLQELNSQQIEAVYHIEGPLLVLAGAGSGKTRIVTSRVAHLLQMGVPATEILAVTFTNKAAEEMQNRIHSLAHHRVLACTFHSLCARILRADITSLNYTNNFTIYDEDDTEKIVKECLTQLNIPVEKGIVKSVRSQISQVKNDLLDIESMANAHELLPQIYRLYQDKLRNYQAVDFDDLLFLTVTLFREHPEVLQKYQNQWSFLLIDEYQDTNAAQYELVRLLAFPRNNLFAVGDPDQSIYSWRGARIHNILNFQQDFAGARVITLEQNYRSQNTILQAANAVISHNTARYEKNLWSAKGAGQKIGLFIADTDRGEAEFVIRTLKKHHRQNVSLGEMAIFYRTNAQSRTFEDLLLREGIPYIIIGGISFYQRREIKDVLSMLRIVDGGADFLAFQRTINLPRRGFGAVALNKLHQLAFESNLSIYPLCEAILERTIDCTLSQKQREGLGEYVKAIRTARGMLHAKMPIHEVLHALIENSRYLEHLREDPESYNERKENVAELISKAATWEEEREHPDLCNFLEELSLKSSAEETLDSDEVVRMMTLHNSKGLEFSCVMLVGMEEELFPHVNSRDEPHQLEEERRLFYVGMTRAKDFLYLTAAKNRYLWGTPRIMRPSRFLYEIPNEYLEKLHQKAEQSSDGEIRLANGTRVEHRDFGEGIILKSYSTSLGLTYDVYFSDAEIERSLVGKYAKLRVCD